MESEETADGPASVLFDRNPFDGSRLPDNAQEAEEQPRPGAHYHWNANTTDEFTTSTFTNEPRSPTEAVAGARHGPDLLRRLSIVKPPHAPKPGNILALYKQLNLSGRVISVCLAVPYSIAYNPDSEDTWVSLFRM